MACAEYEELILDYFDGVLSLEQRQSLQAHLGGCPGCHEFWEAQQDLDTALAGRLSRMALTAGFEQRVLERLNPDRSWYLPQLLDLAGYLALGAAGGYVLFHVASQPAVEAAFPQFASYASWAAGALFSLYLLWVGVKPSRL